MSPLVVLAASLAAGPAVAQVESVDIRTPPPFGVFIGDAVRHEVTIAAPPDFRLDPATIPQPGPRTYWLDLRSVSVDDGRVTGGQRLSRLALEYQTFYAPLQPQRMDIPSFTVTLRDGETRADAVVPAWTFLMSPLREIMPQGDGGPASLRPDVPPPLIGLGAARFQVAGATGASLLFLVLIAHHRAWWPFRGRRPRPFARAFRAVRRATARGDAEGYRAGLLAVHRAFDATAGRRLLAEDLPAFLRATPGFQALEDDIGRFFLASRRAFFAADMRGATAVLPPKALADLGRRLARTERAVR